MFPAKQLCKGPRRVSRRQVYITTQAALVVETCLLGSAMLAWCALTAE